MFTLNITGHPAAQGSKRHVGRGRMVEMSKRLPAWRAAIIAQARQQLGPDWEAYDGPLHAVLTVLLPMPKRSSFGAYPAGPPDLDKLQRAIGDALTQAGAIHDDARIVRWTARKEWAPGQPGATITITRLDQD